MVRVRALIAAGLFACAGTSGCTSKTGGDVLAQVLVGVVSVAAEAALSGGNSSPRGYEVPEPDYHSCQSERSRWQEAHDGTDDALPARLQCLPNGDWPDASVAVVSNPAPSMSSDPFARTPGSTLVCGESETERQRCETLRAVREQRRTGRPTIGPW